jgi:pre-mRNA-splicing factor 38A
VSLISSHGRYRAKFWVCRYLRALAAIYIRMTFNAVEVYELLEPLLKDYRKLRQRSVGVSQPVRTVHSFPNRSTSAGYSLTYMDEFVYALLTEERVVDLILPRLARRQILEESGEIGPRKSRLLDAMEDRTSDVGSPRPSGASSRSVSRGREGTRSPGVRASISPVGSGYRSRSGSGSRSRSRSVSDAGSRYVSRSPSRSPSRSTSPEKMDVDEHKED